MMSIKRRKSDRSKGSAGPRPLLETRVASQLVAKVDKLAKGEKRKRAGMVRVLIEEAVEAREAKRRMSNDNET